MKRRLAALLTLIVIAGLFQGCWNYREVDELSIVAGVAIDKGTEGHKYHLTMDIADTSNAGKDKPVVTELLEAEGDTIFDAIRNASKMTGLTLYWPNCQIAIIGQDVAREGILPIIDFFMRDHEPRLTMELFVSQEKTAKDILAQQSAVTSITSFNIDDVYEHNESMNPIANYKLLYEDYNTLAGEGKALTMASLCLHQTADEKTAALNGMAVFDKDKLAGFIPAEDSHYILYVMDHIKGGVINVKDDTGSTIASLEVNSNKTSVKHSMENGQIKFTVQTQTDVVINELDVSEDFMQKEKIDAFTAMAETQLQDSIANAIKLVQEQYGLDIFGFGSSLHKSDLQTWNQVKQNWNDLFKTLPVEVTCKINIKNSATELKPVKVGG